ncbi:MAG: GGDEF domain-containing protein [Gemmatimonadota bacterium]
MGNVESKETSAEILRLVLPQIARHGGGFEPPSYAVWYEYVSGANPPLKQALEARLAREQPLTAEEVQALYTTFVAPRQAEAVERVQAQLQRTLDEFGRLAQTAGTDAAKYSDSLQSYGDKLTPNMDAEALRGIVVALTAETARMQQSNAQLAEKLEANQRDVDELKSQLVSMKNESLLDPLTGLKNRRGFQKAVDEALAERPQGFAGCTLLMADIDHFKKVNDTHGHLLGDKVLQTVAHVLRSSVKGRDVAARFGGEEFAVLLPDTPVGGAASLAEQIRRTVAQGRIRRSDRSEAIGGVTISLGVAAYRERETLEQWIDRADQALYQSKQAGRDRVTVAAGDPAPA